MRLTDPLLGLAYHPIFEWLRAAAHNLKARFMHNTIPAAHAGDLGDAIELLTAVADRLTGSAEHKTTLVLLLLAREKVAAAAVLADG